MDISYIIVSWNAKDFLLKCLSSIQNDARNFSSEIIVVDNASSDGSPEMVAAQFPEVRLIRNKENLGFAKANNIGIGESRGKYLALINSDVDVLRGCTSLMLDYIEKHDDIGMLGPQILNLDGSVQRSCMGFPTLWNSFCRALALDDFFPKSRFFGSHLMTYWSHNETACVDILIGCFWLIRRQALERVGELDEKFFFYGEDWDWCKRFWAGGWKVVYFNEAKSIHYGGASSAKAPMKFVLELQRSKFRYWNKYHRLPSRLAFLFITFFHNLIRFFAEIIRYAVKPNNRRDTSFKIMRASQLMRWLLGFDIEKRV